MGVSWLKKGVASASLAKQQEVEIEKRKAEKGKFWRFWLKDKEEARVTFVDGALSSEGFLLPPRYYEHNLNLNGNYNNFFVCPEKTTPGEKCPLCDDGDRPYLAALFTIIDHRVFKGKEKDYNDTPKLLLAKPGTFEILNKIAIKRGGLAGCTFDISRLGGDKSASVGDMFDFVEKTDLDVLKAQYTTKVKDEKTGIITEICKFKPADYDTEIVYRTYDELVALGLSKQAPQVSTHNYENDL